MTVEQLLKHLMSYPADATVKMLFMQEVEVNGESEVEEIESTIDDVTYDGETVYIVEA